MSEQYPAIGRSGQRNALGVSKARGRGNALYKALDVLLEL